MSETNLKTPLYQAHLDAGGKLVDFSGWQLPVHYGSQVVEHNACRASAAVFDVSHMTVIDLRCADGEGAVDVLLQQLLANKFKPDSGSGDALYSCMLNLQGGIIDDLIAYRFSADNTRLIVNSATRAKDIQWIEQFLSEHKQVEMHERDDLALLAIQGPEAIDRCLKALHACASQGLLNLRDYEDALHKLARFSSMHIPVSNKDTWHIARTGYTGEDGFEIALPAQAATDLWLELLNAGITPAGLGARDTLRLEAGLNLYGSDMSDEFNPLESGVAWTIAWEPGSRLFNGRVPLDSSRDTNGYTDWQLVGVILDGRGVLRGGQTLHANDKQIGEITSGTFSPTLQRSIALARVSMSMMGVSHPADIYKQDCTVLIRNKPVEAHFAKPPFANNGKAHY